MNAIETSDEKTPAVLLYTPYLQGLYIGELVNQIRQLSYIKGYKLIVVRTGDFGLFREKIHLHNINAAIILRNAISADLVETILNKGIPCVSIAYDYFPLTLPIVTSDNEEGVALAFEHLQKLGHQKIAFVGDLSHYDIRKRYQYYCEHHDRYGLQLREDYLITTTDTLVAGGIEAAKSFTKIACDATAVIFGASLTALGFARQMQALTLDTPTKLEYVCFDAIPLIPVYAPDITCIDQNLHFLAYRAFNSIDHQLQQRPFERHTLVKPKITRLGDSPTDNPDTFITTCADFPELKNSNYVKSILCNFFDWPREIVNSQLDQIMSISMLFEKFMGRCVFSRYYTDSNGTAWTKIIKIYSLGDTQICELSDAESLCKASNFPPKAFADIYLDYGTCFHMPITVSGKILGLLSMAGDPSCPSTASSYFGFSGCIESIVKMYEQQLEISILKKRLHKLGEGNVSSSPANSDAYATVDWTADNNQTSWSEAALAKLGFKSPIEINIFRNMEITDRLHPDNAEQVRVAVLECKQNRSPFQFNAKYRSKSNDYVDAVMHGDPQFDDSNRFKGIIFSISNEDIEQ